ncbi:MAG: RluA family pseudouridine synthase [Myxococcaceae bacterium]|nr:RluA family pseudouridine synthase [Myxococcaceae bacterium]
MKRRTLTAASDGTLGDVLAVALKLPAGAIAHLIAAGAVYVDGRRCRDAAARVKAGAQLTAVLEEAGRPAGAGAPSGRVLTVLFEDPRVIAVDKPPGVLAQPGPSGGENLLALVSARLGHEAGLVHRLDRETSGVTLFGKSREATSDLARAFREGRVTKRYIAVVTAELPDSGEIDLPLSRDPSRPGRWRATRKANGLEAFTRFEVVSRAGGATLVALFPKTGRTHQLRAHLTALGAPIAGDRLYGGADAPRCLLHAHQLRLGELAIEAPVPGDVSTFTASPSR